MNTNTREKIMYKELSYIIQGCFFDIRKNYGPGQKESVYGNLFAECLERNNIQFEREKQIAIYSNETGKKMGTYKPDFVIDGKVIIELKSSRFTTKQDEKQLYHYLRNSKYELGYIVNFSTPRLFIKRIVYSNEKKSFLRKSGLALLCIFVFSFALFSVFNETEAASIDNFQVAPGTNLLEVRGSCTGRAVAVHIFQPNAGEPFYTAGAECKNGLFNFKDDLGYWKIAAGAYRVVVYDENSPRANPSGEEEFRIENVTTIEAEKQEVLEPAVEETTNPVEASSTTPEVNDDSSSGGILQQMWEAFQNMGELVKTALASLGLFIENGIAKVTELIAGKIVADEASIKNLEVSEKIQLRDHATGNNYCTWIENGEWVKRLGECQDDTNQHESAQPLASPASSPTAPQDTNLHENEQSASTTPVEESTSTPPVVEPVPVEAPSF